MIFKEIIPFDFNYCWSEENYVQKVLNTLLLMRVSAVSVSQTENLKVF